MLSVLQNSPMLTRVASLSHDEIALLIALVNGVSAMWTAWLARRNRRDIDGVAERVGTERALARCAKKNKRCEK